MYGADVVGGSGDLVSDVVSREGLGGEAEAVMVVFPYAVGTAEVREGSAAARSVPGVV